MKKVILFIVLFLCFISSAFADENPVITKNYSITVDEKTYTVSVDYVYNLNGEGAYVCNFDSIKLNSEDGMVSYNMGPNNGAMYYLSEKTRPDYDNVISEWKPELLDEQLFTAEQITNDEYMSSFLPRFMFNLSGNYVKPMILVYTLERDFDTEQKKQIFEIIKKNDNEWSDYSFSSVYGVYSDFVVDYTGHEYFDTATVEVNDKVKKQLFELASSMYVILKEVKDLEVCNTDDLKTMKSFASFNFMELKKKHTAISSSCQSKLFGDDQLFDMAMSAKTLIQKYGVGDSEYLNTLAFLYLQSMYLSAYGFMTGSELNVSTETVVSCKFLGDGTEKLFQTAFEVIKYAGIVFVILFGTVDIVKAVVSKDQEAMKKQYNLLFKRIAALVFLLLLPIIVRIIFELINVIGIDDPICGIR